jgi:ABC-type branched-subunit amino acid transport system ATPase component
MKCVDLFVFHRHIIRHVDSIDMCGKTTLLRTIVGFAKPFAGSIQVGDRDVTQMPPDKRGKAFVLDIAG